MPSRRKTREFVLQVLFAADVRKQDPADTLDFLEIHFGSEEDEELKIHRVVMPFARDLVTAVANDRQIIDDLIARVSHHWKLYRINRVDRNILRMAIAEMIHFADTPSKVILNEAIEIGKKYGGENSGAFINGILDTIHTAGRRPQSAKELESLFAELDESHSTS